MDISLFDYHLPKELIAQIPNRSRSASRLLVYDRERESIQHSKFKQIIDYLKPGDALVLNNTKVFKARLWGHRKTGGKIEVFLVRRLTETPDERWEGLVSPSRRLHEGETIQFDDKHGVFLEKEFGNGRWFLRFDSQTSRQRILARFGHVPLPHYIDRSDKPEDIRRYQTVFADKYKVGAVAAPTAGFHFTSSLLHKIEEMGVHIIYVTLHVGPGTFKPVKTEQVEDHTVDPEYAELSADSAKILNQVRKAGKSIFAVGTTSVRTLESAEIINGSIKPFAGMVNLYIRPGFKFRVVNHLVTNFHIPRSSLLILVSSFAGRENILRAYREAIAMKYRFYSYGDSMLIL